MVTRRTLLLSPLAAAALASRASAAAVTPEQARQFIDRTAKEMIAVIDGNAPTEQKRAQLQQIIDRAVAVEEVGRFCLGRYWRAATPEQRQQYLQLFHRVLLNSITGHIGEYKGVTYTLGRPVPGNGGIEVPSVLNRPGQPSANLTWLVSGDGGNPKIIDVIAEGTSMRITQRSDYDSYLSRNGGRISALLEAMKRQASQTG
jgi:phospholipid transport system substrate-binding protein